MKILFHPVFFFLLISLFWFIPESCVSDKLDPIENLLNCDSLALSYEIEMKPIIDKSCAYAGCHISGSSIGDFSTYTGMFSLLETNAVEDRVLNLGDMPPDFVTEEAALSPDEIEFFSCWLESGYPEL
ncbi:MAG: hypothetical protein KDC34_08865 [Saprospiraceae bacterium]|nr:hypothetical protein [Saprospiraceae bacterium]